MPMDRRHQADCDGPDTRGRPRLSRASVGGGYAAAAGECASDSGSEAGSRRTGRRPRRMSDVSDTGFPVDVCMAQTEVFAGPTSESVPSNTASFASRRMGNIAPMSLDGSYSRPASEHELTGYDSQHHSSSHNGGRQASAHQRRTPRGHDSPARSRLDYRLESGSPDDWTDDELHAYSESARYDEQSNAPELEQSRHGLWAPSVNEEGMPLLARWASRTSHVEAPQPSDHSCQKLYIASEDLTISLSGYKSSHLRSILYGLVCCGTLGVGYLLLRWLPRWRTRLQGRPSSLGDCDWVVIENQWREIETQRVRNYDYGRPLSTLFGPTNKDLGTADGSYEVSLDTLQLIDYRYIRFYYHPLRHEFVLGNSWKDPAWAELDRAKIGLASDEIDSRETVFASNSIEIREKGTITVLLDEVLHPFYIFQIASLILWSLEEYYYYAACIFAISAVSIITTLLATKSTMARLRELSRFECKIRVLRNGFWRYVESAQLVPGDVFEITDPGLNQFPCDSLLLSGDCIVNESMLTGESVPVSKSPASDESVEKLELDSASFPAEVAKHVLFCGTKIIRARRPVNADDHEAAAVALVLRTGFNTTKGSLVRSMLFPKPSGFKFYRDAFRYILVMACIAFVAFLACLVNFVRLGLAWHVILIRALDLVTIVVPPALPATLTIGTTFALSRLKAKQIFCISPQRINYGGKLDIVCFDKTGTLTEEGLDVSGVHVAHPSGKSFTDLTTSVISLLPDDAARSDYDYSVNQTMLFTMATCHSLRIVDDELIGDPLDAKMFEFTGWSLEENEPRSSSSRQADRLSLTPLVAKPPPGFQMYVHGKASINATLLITQQENPLELGILRSFEFASQLRRASVVVRRFGEVSIDVYVKGAPESIVDICRTETLPPDYDSLLRSYTHRGYRIIACASKHYDKLNWVKVQKMSRADAESQLDFAGFIIFENKLKPVSAGVIDELGRAGIRRVMCTGDNILTAISVARECGLIEREAHCFVPQFIEARLGWESINDPTCRLDDAEFKPRLSHDASLPYEVSLARNYSLAVPGDVFRWILDYAPENVVHLMLVRGQVFARMSPDEKHELVERLQAIDYCCAFCGDGANDCGALKAADVGVSLSEAEASVAAPFTSRVFDISCVPEVIREGRAALVTSFSCFKYMSLYSAIQFTSVSFLYASASNLGDAQYLYIDLFLILPIAILMGWSGPYPKLVLKRPTASLVSRKVLTPLLGQIALAALVQLAAFLLVQRQSWYIPPKVHRRKANIRNSQNTALFLLSCFQYILSAIVLSVGAPYRRSLIYNVPFVIALLAAASFSTYLLLYPAPWLVRLMQLTALTWSFKACLLALGASGFGLSYIGEGYLFPRLARWIGLAKRRLGATKKKRKMYKEIERALGA